MIDRSSFSTSEIVQDLWSSLSLPHHALASLSLPNQDQRVLPSSYKISVLAQASIGVSGLAAALLHSQNNKASAVSQVTVPLRHAAAEFKSERLYTINNGSRDEPPVLPWGSIGGLHRTVDGAVRIHDSFPNHSEGTLRLLSLPPTASHADVATKVALWRKLDLEKAATEDGELAVYALRSYAEWDRLPQADATADYPVCLRQLSQYPANSRHSVLHGSQKCLQGLRVIEMSRVIAAPVAGQVLAAHGADVLWVTSPTLPDLPALDRNFSRGKRTIQLDVNKEADKQQLLELLRTADVFIQAFRPGSLAAYGFSPEKLIQVNPHLVCANLSAFGPDGPWANRRGFDSLVQTCSGMNISEAEHFGQGELARPAPCQVLDHASGYLLATGIIAALYHQNVTSPQAPEGRGEGGGSWVVDVSLAGVMKYLRSLGQYPGNDGFGCADFEGQQDVPKEVLETRQTVFGQMTFVKHSVSIQGCDVGWTEMPKRLGSDEAVWLP